jgi:hypothetical protein
MGFLARGVAARPGRLGPRAAPDRVVATVAQPIEEPAKTWTP